MVSEQAGGVAPGGDVKVGATQAVVAVVTVSGIWRVSDHDETMILRGTHGRRVLQAKVYDTGDRAPLPRPPGGGVYTL